MNKSRLQEALLGLPEPVMIVGNRIPDGDSLGACAAVLDFLRNEGVEAYVHCVKEPSPGLAWMVDSEDSCKEILEDYNSLVVVDDEVDANRLGITIKLWVPIINIDHHMGNFPEKMRQEISERGTSNTMHENGKITHFWADVPATACLLIDEDILHPYLWVSLYTDSVGFTVNCVDAIYYANELIHGLELKTPELEEMLSKLKTKGKLSDLQALMHGSLYLISGTHEGQEVAVVVGVADVQGSEGYKKLLGNLRQFSHVTAFINSGTGQVSFRSDFTSFNVLEIAQKFGGGGHVRAAGCTLDKKDLLNDTDKLINLLLAKLENPRTKWIM